MGVDRVTTAERTQWSAARILATHPAGRGLLLVGGFRYRLVNDSPRTSHDIDYHWDGDLEQKQKEVVEVLRNKLLADVKRQFGYEGDVRPATGHDAQSPAVCTVELAFYRIDEPGSRIEVPIEITRIARLDMPTVHTVSGTVFPTVSDADMIESKVLACLERSFFQVRDALDLFLFQDTLRPDASARLSEKLRGRSLSPADALKRLDRLAENSTVHVRSIERMLDEQVDATAAENLRAAGGAAMVWDTVMRRLRAIVAEIREQPS